MSKNIIAHFIGGPLHNKDKVLEELISEYKLPTRVRYPIKINLPNGYITIAISVQQNIIYRRSINPEIGTSNLYLYIHQPIEKLEISADLLHGNLKTINGDTKL